MALGKCCACDVAIPAAEVINFDQMCAGCRAEHAAGYAALRTRPCASCSLFGHDPCCSFCGGARSPKTLAALTGERLADVAASGRTFPYVPRFKEIQ